MRLAVKLKVSRAVYVLDLVVRLASSGTSSEWGVFGFKTWCSEFLALLRSSLLLFIWVLCFGIQDK